MTKEIKSNIVRHGNIHWKNFKFFQDSDFKSINQDEFEALKQSIIQYNFSDTFKICYVGRNNTEYCFDGYHRQKALLELEQEGYTIPDELPATYYKYNTKKEAVKAMLAIFNSKYARITDEGLYKFQHEHDLTIEDIELNLHTPEINLDLYKEGWGNDNGQNGGNDQDDLVPEVDEVNAISRLGDVWLLGGKHRLFCGDCTVKENVELLMDGKKANLLMTSPPYWVGKDYEKERTEEEIAAFINKSVNAFMKAMSKDESRIIINTGTGKGTAIGEPRARTILLIDKWVNALTQHDWILRHIRYWDKSGGGNAIPMSALSDYVYPGLEFLLVFYNYNGKHRGQNKISEPAVALWAQQSSWTDIKGDRQHNKAGYPVELPHRFIKLYTLHNEIIFEPFAGNGTNYIACHNNNRVCYGMEIDTHYCDVILKRFMEYTATDDVLRLNDGKTWRELNNE